MNTLEVVDVIRNKFSVTGNTTQVPYIGKSGSFTSELLDTGIKVNNLGNQPFLPWSYSRKLSAFSSVMAVEQSVEMQ